MVNLSYFLLTTLKSKMNPETTLESFYPDKVCFQKVLFSSVNIAYVELGDPTKPTILFIHGLSNALTVWNKNLPILSKKFHCIAIDLPGSGLSSKDKSYPYGMEFFASAIQDFITQKSLKNVFLCGHSMGGQIALTLAITKFKPLKGLILCAPAGIEQFNALERNLYKNTMLFVDMLSTEENSLRKALNNSFYIMPASAKQLIQEQIDLLQTHDQGHYRLMMERCIAGMLEEPVYEKLDQIEVPVFILFGEKDSLIPNKIIHPISIKTLLEKSMAKFSMGSYHIVEKCGHFVQWENADDVNHYIEDFVKEVSNLPKKD